MSSRLDEWIETEARLRGQRGAGGSIGVTAPTAVASMSGLDMMQAMMRGQTPAAPISQTMDFLLVEVEHGRAVFQATPGPKFINPLGTMHGGWYATLLDSALGCCVHSALPQGKSYTTLELKVNLIRAVKADLPRVRAEGRVVHVGGQTATAEARLVGPDDKLYAHATTTCLVFDLRPPKAA